jgi:penicillin-binding protein 2
MYRRSDELGPEMNNRLALRIAVFGGFALALFAILFFRLWFLQVLNGDKYLAEANNNRTREYRVSAPRGEILDRNGRIIVANRTSLALQINPRKLPAGEAERRGELARLAKLIHTTPHKLRKTLHEQLLLAPSAPVTVRKDVGDYLVYYLQENQDRFPGIAVQRVFVRRYPHGTLAAHILGNVNEINGEQLKEPRYRGLQPSDEIGQEGVEDTYDRSLRGQPGIKKIQVDAFGQPTRKGQLVSEPPVPGNNLKLTIDSSVQEAGEAALAGRGLPGGFVAMNARNGELLGLGSFPTFYPSVFTKPLTQAQVDALYRDPVAAPITDRAIAGLYPTGSTFKLITALAALESGVITPSSAIYDGGTFEVGGQSFQNAGGASYGSLTLVPALQVSSDVFFYTLGFDMWDTGQLQRWAHRLGIGRSTGIDLPGGQPGLLPTKKWRDRLASEGLAEERPWSAGDNIQLATGQGDLQASPLQMAIAYATLANDGTVVTPHVGREVTDAAGRVLKEFTPKPQRRVEFKQESRDAILEGLHLAAQAPGGTSYAIFGGFPVPVAGKTGTAQRDGHADQSWYVVAAPYPDPRIVVAVTIEEGGFGAESAAPAALQILEAYFGKHSSGESGPNGGSPG